MSDRVRLALDDDFSRDMHRAAVAAMALDRNIPKIRWRRRLRILFTGR